MYIYLMTLNILLHVHISDDSEHPPEGLASTYVLRHLCQGSSVAFPLFCLMFAYLLM